MDMVRTLTIAFAAAGIAAGADFSIQIGNPVAAEVKKIMKDKTFVVMAVRAQGCADPAKARFTGTAVRGSGSARESAALTFAEGSPGSFAVISAWPPSNAAWLAVITGDCQGSKAGALVPMNAQGSYVREASQFFNHAPTDAEMETMMKTVMGGLR